MTKTALILGVTGGIGGEVATALSRRGWQINALHRNPSKTIHPSRAITWIQGDAMNQADVIKAARGASLIVHAVNPPGYRNWAQLVLPMLESSIQAARASGARILLPGTIYNYGPDAFPLLRENSPQNPLTRKGRIRAEMEHRLRLAAASGVRSLVVRAGDFFGPNAGNNWFSQGLIKPGKPVTSISYPGRRGLGHAWAYLPDLAETMAQLVERESTLGTFETFHFAGHWDADGTQMTQAISAVASLAVCHLVSRDTRDAISVARAVATEQRQIIEHTRSGSANSPGGGCQAHTDWLRMSGGQVKKCLRETKQWH
jgi:nucleoside-diphosphate-sugar epimerase